MERKQRLVANVRRTIGQNLVENRGHVPVLRRSTSFRLIVRHFHRPVLTRRSDPKTQKKNVFRDEIVRLTAESNEFPVRCNTRCTPRDNPHRFCKRAATLRFVRREARRSHVRKVSDASANKRENRHDTRRAKTHVHRKFEHVFDPFDSFAISFDRIDEFVRLRTVIILVVIQLIGAENRR